MVDSMLKSSYSLAIENEDETGNQGLDIKQD